MTGSHSLSPGLGVIPSGGCVTHGCPFFIPISVIWGLWSACTLGAPGPSLPSSLGPWAPPAVFFTSRTLFWGSLPFSLLTADHMSCVPVSARSSAPHPGAQGLWGTLLYPPQHEASPPAPVPPPFRPLFSLAPTVGCGRAGLRLSSLLAPCCSHLIVTLRPSSATPCWPPVFSVLSAQTSGP